MVKKVSKQVDLDQNDVVQEARLDVNMEGIREAMRANDKMMLHVKAGIATLFEHCYGQAPDESSDLWTWFLTEQFNNCMKLAVTKAPQTRS